MCVKIDESAIFDTTRCTPLAALARSGAAHPPPPAAGCPAGCPSGVPPAPRAHRGRYGYWKKWYQKRKTFVQVLRMSNNCCNFAAVMEKFTTIFCCLGVFIIGCSVVGLEVLQLRALRAIATRPEVSTLVTDDGVIDHAEQRADNNVTIMFNYE